MLVRGDKPGSYLVRESQSKPGDYTLSLYDGKVAHYRINEDKSQGKVYIRSKQMFNSIKELIEYHQGQ
jgi:fyn-related kinase